MLRKLELKIALNLEISSKLIFMEIFYLHPKRYKSYTKNGFKRLRIENEANKRKKMKNCLLIRKNKIKKVIYKNSER